MDGGAIAYGSIAADGTYELKTGGSQGLTPGSFRVTVVSTEPPSLSIPSGRAPPPGRLITPQRYVSVDTTDLTAEIEPGHNEIDLKLVLDANP